MGRLLAMLYVVVVSSGERDEDNAVMVVAVLMVSRSSLRRFLWVAKLARTSRINRDRDLPFAQISLGGQK
jgi:hypothetical protein